MEMSQEDFDRILSFDQARRDSEALYAVNPDDADNLTRWGEALLELSHVQDADCCVEMIEDAVSKLEKALLVDPTKHETLWCLGNAHTSRGFCTAEHDLAKVYFRFAAQCYENALQEDPGNKMYAKSLEMALKGPELHLELQSQSRSQQASVGGSSVSNAKESKEQSEDSLMYDIFGWVILAVGLIACVAMSSSQAPPPSPRRKHHWRAPENNFMKFCAGLSIFDVRVDDGYKLISLNSMSKQHEHLCNSLITCNATLKYVDVTFILIR